MSIHELCESTYYTLIDQDNNKCDSFIQAGIRYYVIGENKNDSTNIFKRQK